MQKNGAGPEMAENNTAYRIVTQAGSAGIEEKKSRFIADVFPVRSVSDAEARISEVTRKYWDAKHHCYAYIIGSRSEVSRCSDNGEPSGTAGKPILEAIKKTGVQDTVIVVTRYFGGTKLGAGGLVRAYGKSAYAGLEAATIIAQEPHAVVKISCEYTMLGTIDNYIRHSGCIVKSKDFAADVVITVLVPCGDEQDIAVQIADRTGGQATLESIGFEYVAKVKI